MESPKLINYLIDILFFFGVLSPLSHACSFVTLFVQGVFFFNVGSKVRWSDHHSQESQIGS
jgi:hypothetical protein